MDTAELPADHRDDKSEAGMIRNVKRDSIIRARAQQIWVERGAGEGHALDDWLQAEQEYRTEHAI